jgi:hypothetical protein
LISVPSYGFWPCSWALIGLPNYPQTVQRALNCGPACLNSVLLRHGKFTSGDLGLWDELGILSFRSGVTEPMSLLALGAGTRGLYAKVQRGLTVRDLWRYLEADEDFILQWFYVDTWHFSALTGLSALDSPAGRQYYGIRMMEPWPDDPRVVWRRVDYFLPNWSGAGVRISAKPLLP